MRTYDMEERGALSLYEYLYRCIRRDILSGALRPGEKLPSRRRLAEHLRVSVITVEAAYEEGYRHFICGMAMGCDLYFCECLLALREKHADVTIEAAIPCPTQPDA